MIYQDSYPFSNQINYKAASGFALDFALDSQKELLGALMCLIDSTEQAIASKADLSEVIPELEACNKTLNEQVAEVGACLNAVKRIAQETHEQHEPCELFETRLTSVFANYFQSYRQPVDASLDDQECADSFSLI